MVPNHDITDENRAFRNVNALAELRQFPLVFKQHHSKLTEVSTLHQLHGPACGIDRNEQHSQRTPALGKTSRDTAARKVIAKFQGLRTLNVYRRHKNGPIGPFSDGIIRGSDRHDVGSDTSSAAHGEMTKVVRET
jgi:hypothetical protein